jgi:hypothetical protein
MAQSASYLLTYLLTPWSRVFLEKLTGFQLVKEFPAFCGTRRFITVFTKGPTPVPILSQINLVHAPIPLPWNSILILSSHLRLGLPSGLFLSGFPTKTLYGPLFSPYVLHAPPTSFLQRASGEANMSPAEHKHPRIHYFLRNTSPLLPTLSQINPAHPVFFSISGLIQHYHLRLGFPRGPCPSGFLVKL